MRRPKLYLVQPQDDFSIILHYDNGEIRLYDCTWIFKETEVFEKIRDIKQFKELCTVMNGTLAWDISGKRDPYTCIDICPDTIYEESIKINKIYNKKPA